MQIYKVNLTFDPKFGMECTFWTCLNSPTKIIVFFFIIVHIKILLMHIKQSEIKSKFELLCRADPLTFGFNQN